MLNLELVIYCIFQYITLYSTLCIYFYMGCWTFTVKCCTGFIHNIFVSSHIHTLFLHLFLQTLCCFFSIFIFYDLSHWFNFSYILSYMLLFALACSIQPTSILKGSCRKKARLSPLGTVTCEGVNPRFTPNGKVPTLIWAEKPCCA